MADFLLDVGINPSVSLDTMRSDLSQIISKLNEDAPKIAIKLDFAGATAKEFLGNISEIKNSLATIGNVQTSGIEKLSSDLSTVLGLVDQISKKEFNVTNKFGATNRSDPQRVALVREETMELAKLTKQYFDFITVQGNVNKLTAGFGVLDAAKLPELFNILNKFDDINFGKTFKSIESASTVSELTKIGIPLQRLSELVSEVIEKNRELGASVPKIDTSGYENATARVKEYDQAHKELEAEMRKTAGAIGVSTQGTASQASAAQVNASQLTASNLALDPNAIKSSFQEISSTLTDIRSQIEATFDLSTVDLHVGEIKGELLAVAELLKFKNKGGETTDSTDQQIAAAKRYENVLTQIVSLQGSLRRTGGEGTTQYNLNNAELENHQKHLEAIYSLYEDGEISFRAFSTAMGQVEASLKSTSRATKEYVADQRNLGKVERDISTIQKTARTMYDRGIDALRRNAKAKNSNIEASRASYKAIEDDTEALRRAIAEYDGSKEAADRLRQATDKLSGSLLKGNAVFKTNGDNVKSFGAKLKGVIAHYFSMMRVTMAVIRTIKKMAQSVVELNDSLTQLQIVTGASSNQIAKYSQTAFESAKRLGVQVKDVIDSTTTYARLGYTLPESNALAEYTTMLQNVGGIETQDAQDAVTAIVKAFKIDVDDIENVMDKLVKVGNNFPISVEQIAEGMNNASSSMAAAGNTFEQSVALLAAANTTVQNAARASTALRTITARIRNTKTDLEELGEDMTESKYEEVVSALTDAKVKLLDVNNEYRSTYDILSDIAATWGTLSDKTRAALTTALAGTRQQDIFLSIISNFREASGAMNAMESSSGSLNKAYSVYQDSITAHINKFKTAFQEMASTLFSSGFLSDVVDLGSNLMKIAKGLATVINYLGGLKTVLISVTGIIVGIKWEAIYTWLLKIAKRIRTSNLVTGLSRLKSSLLGVRGAANRAYTSLVPLEQAGAGVAQGMTAIQKATVGITAAAVAFGIAMSIINAIRQAAQKRLQEAQDAATELNEATESADEYRSKILELREAIDSGNISEEEAYNKRKELIQIQDELIEKYGSEAEGINLVSGNIDTLNEKLDNLSKKQWEVYRRGNWTQISDSIEAMTKDYIRFSGISYSGFDPSAYKTIYDAMDARNRKYESLVSQYKKQGLSDADARDRASTEFNTGAGIAVNYQAILDKHEKIFNAYMEGLLRYDSKYSDTWAEVLSRQSEFEEALINGDSATVKTAVEGMHELEKAMYEAASDSPELFTYISHFFKIFREKAKDYEIEISLLPKINAPDDKMGQAISAALKAFTGDDGKVSFSKVLDVEASFNEEHPDSNLASEIGVLASKLDISEVANNSEKAYWMLRAAADYYGVSVEDLVKKLVGLNDELEKTTSKGKSIQGMINQIESSLNGLGQLDKIYADILNGEDFDFSSLVSEDFVNAFSGYEEEYNNFINTIANSPDDIGACQAAFDNLTTAYLNQSGILKELTDENRNTTVAMLEQMGIANAAQIVDYQLALQKERAKYATEEFANMTYEEIMALYRAAEAGTVTKQVLAELALEKALINSEGINTAPDVDNIIALANAANATTQTLKNLAAAKELFAKADAASGSAKAFNNLILNADNERDAITLEKLALRKLKQAEEYRKQGQELLNQQPQYDTIDSSQFKAQYTGGATSRGVGGAGSGGSGGSSGSSSSEKVETWFDKQYAYHKHLVAMEQETDEAYFKWLESAYKKAYSEGIIELEDYRKYQEEVYKGLQTVFKDYLSDVEHEISLRENYTAENKTIISRYKTLMSAVEKEIKAARARGLKNTDSYIQELQKKWYSYSDSIKKLQDEITDNAKDAVDKLVDIRIDMLKQDIDDQKDAIDKKLDALKEFYDKQKEMLQDVYDEEKYLEEQAEKRKSVADIQAQIAQLEFDNSAWAQKRRLELAEELSDAQKELRDFEKDHALEVAQEELDKLYEMQEKELNAQNDMLESKEKNAKELYDQALNDIKNGSVSLYNEMIEWNNVYGDGIKDTIKDAWEEAYVALKDYKDLYGSFYNGVKLANATGYAAPKETYANSAVVKSTTSSSSSSSKSTSSTAKKTTTSSAPALSKGSTITVKTSATNFSAKSGNLRMASFVPGSKFTVYDIAGNEVLIGLNGVYTGWINKSDIVGYARGTRKAVPGLHKIDEQRRLGSETIFESASGARYKMFTGGEKVLNAKASNFLYDFATTGGNVLSRLVDVLLGNRGISGTNAAAINNDIRLGDIIVNGNADKATVSEIRRAQRDSLETMLKELNKLNRKAYSY